MIQHKWAGGSGRRPVPGGKILGMTVARPGPAGAPERARARWVLVTAAAGLVLAVPVMTWWLVGPLNTAPARVGLDYAFRPWPISPGAADAAGIASAALAALSLPILVWATLRRLLDSRWWAVLIPLLAAGFIAAAGWRVMTAGVLGSNIGAGFVEMLGGPVVLALVAWAAIYSVHLVRRSRRRAARSIPDA
jgi:hypothetical protein